MKKYIPNLVKKISTQNNTKMAHKQSIPLHASTTNLWQLSNTGHTHHHLKLICWNVNGFRSVLKKGCLQSLIQSSQPDFMCLNQTKLNLEVFNRDSLSKKFPSLYQYWNFCKVSAGYSGVSVFSKFKPLHIYQDFQLLDPLSYSIQYSLEGRLLTLQFQYFYLVNVYKPSVGQTLNRLGFRIQYQKIFNRYLKLLKQKKGVIVCGDMNVAHNQIDLALPKNNKGKAGFTKQERQQFTNFLNLGFRDVYRQKYPNKKQYTWWSNYSESRKNNIGWRIDYFLVSDNLKYNQLEPKIQSQIFGSDHCPISLNINLVV